MASIGSNIIIGYIDDKTTGKEIVDEIAACRKAGCRDIMRDLLDQLDGFDQAAFVGMPAPPGASLDRSTTRRLRLKD